MTLRMGVGSVALVACVLAVAGLALAESKSDAKDHEEGLIKDASTTLQGACGCPGLKYTIDWDSYTRAIDIEHVSHPALALADAAPRICSDKTKAAWCKWSKNVVYKIHLSKTKHFVFNVSKDGKTYDCGTAPYEAGEAACDGEAVIDAFQAAN